MNIKLKANFLVMGKNETPSKDGKAIYYNLAVMQDGQAGNISCPKEVYDMVQPMFSYDCELAYSEQYSSLRLVGVYESTKRDVFGISNNVAKK